MQELGRKSIAVIALAGVVTSQLGTTRTYARQDPQNASDQAAVDESRRMSDGHADQARDRHHR